MNPMPILPSGYQWPAHMLGTRPIDDRLRATYARICHQVAANRAAERDRQEALAMLAHAWCRIPTEFPRTSANERRPHREAA